MAFSKDSELKAHGQAVHVTGNSLYECFEAFQAPLMLCHDVASTRLKIINSLTEYSLDGWHFNCSGVWEWHYSIFLDALRL